MAHTRNSAKGKHGFQVTHGLSKSPEYQAWNGMKHRCLNPNYHAYKKYGAIGVRVCDRWRDSFEAFYADMGPRPSSWHSLDRINPWGDYEPGNCRWALPIEQGSNRKVTRHLEHDGQTKTTAEWAEAKGMDVRTLRMRLYMGWTVERALTEPVGSNGPKRRVPARSSSKRA